MTTSILTSPPPGRALESAKWLGATGLALAIWFAIYWQLEPFATWAVAQLPVTPGSHLEEALRFFVFDTPKVLMLLGLVVLGVSFVQTFISPESTRDLLAKRTGAWSNLLASLLGGAGV